MTIKKYFGNLNNSFYYLFTTLLLNFLLYILIAEQFKGFYNPVLGATILIVSILVDYFLSAKRFRILIRFLIVIACFLILKFFIFLFSNLAAPSDGYNLIIDKLSYLFNRDTLLAIFFIIFYYIFDSVKIIRSSIIGYIISTLILIALYFTCLNFDVQINKTIFINYFNLSVFLILIVGLFILRHSLFYQGYINRKFEKKDLLLFIPLFLGIIFIFFSIILPKYIDEKSSKNSGLFEQSLFMFDFSNFIELKDEIKLSNDRVLILELSGVKDKEIMNFEKGWNRQLYLKRFALEEYKNDGKFKTADEYLDPESPPVYISGYQWELKNKPEFKERTNIKETFYLINIDPSSLMGSDLLTRISPLTNWPNSPYKQIYNSYCYTSSASYTNLLFTDMSQNKFIKTIHPKRKELLLNWGASKTENKIKNLALNILNQYNISSDMNPYIKTLAIQDYLLNNYFYSLKPGLAKNGNQLEYFLFESKKGYCSYFAFAMTLMLRSLEIPSRVVVGFAPDMRNKTMNFYDVRSMDGHAWVEVFFDDYGWLTFDPTSSNFAPDDKYQFDMGNKQERDNLIEDILKNKNKLKEITQQQKNIDSLKDFTHDLKRSIRLIGIIFFIFIIISIIILINIKKKYYFIRYKLTNDQREKIKYLYMDTLARLIDYNFIIRSGESIKEFANRLKDNNVIDIINLTGFFQKATFKEQGKIDIDIEYIKEMKRNINIEFKSFSFKKKLFSCFNFSRLWKKILPIIFFLFLFGLNLNLFCDIKTPKDKKVEPVETKSIDVYVKEGNDAINSGYFDKAINIFNEAEITYPRNYQPNYYKGRLFYFHELYENAVIEFLKAKNKGLMSEENYHNIANCYGSIGEDQKAVKIYEEAFEYLYPSKALYDKLGWMYFKVHDINNGIRVVKEGLEKYPGSSDLYMTLGTLYSSSKDYAKSKMCYIDSINYSYEDYNSNYFRSIAYYNLSLLENSFFYFDDAYNAARASLSIQDRSSAHLELNYLYLGSLDMKNAYSEVISASRLEPKTAFPEMSIVYLYLYCGKIDEAIVLTKKLLANKDFSWMLYFGTNKDAYYSEIYKDLSDAYELKINQINYNDELDIINTVLRPFKKIYYLIKQYYYNFKYANLLIKIGEEKIKGGSELEGLFQLYDAYEKIFPAKALKVLKLAEKMEVNSNPQKQKVYNIKKAILKKQSSIFYSNSQKKKELLKNIEQLDQKWQKDLIVDALVEIIKSSWGKEKEKYINELFLIYPPFLPLSNFKIKMDVVINKSNIEKKVYNKLNNILSKRGIINYNNARIKLFIDKNYNSEYFIQIFDNNNLIKESIIIPEKKDNIDSLGLEIFNKIFIYDLE